MYQPVARTKRIIQLTHETCRDLTGEEYDDVIEAWNGKQSMRQRRETIRWCIDHGHAYHRVPGGRRLVCVRCTDYVVED